MKHLTIILILTALQALVAIFCVQAAEPPFIYPHPWQSVNGLGEKEINKYKEYVSPIIEMPDKAIVALIPVRRPVGGDLSQLGEEYKGTITWTPEYPDFLTINNIRFIPEKQFSPTGIEKVEGPDGQIFNYEYVIGKNSKKIYITSVRDAVARDWLRDAAYKLARLYIATGQDVYAHKAAVIIAAFADVVPFYAIHGKPSGKGDSSFYKEEPYPQHTGRWGTLYTVELRLIEPLVLAYDLILPSGAIQRLSNEWRRDLKSDIEKGFLLDYCFLIQKYDQWYAKTRATRTNNLQPYKCRGMIAIGRTIERPDLIHYAFSFIEEMINRRFGLDGVFPESPSYHKQVLGNLSVALGYLRGYSDPPDFTNPMTGRRFDDFDPDSVFPTFKKAKGFLKACSFPDGTPMGVHDTHIRPDRLFKRDITTSRIWPSFGHAVLGRGHGDHQFEAHLDYGFDYSHRHNDTLNLILWACGEELLSDIGYTYTYRGWATGSLSHNLVVVDGMVQKTGILNPEHPENANGGRIKTWAPVSNGYGVIEAEDINSYPQCSTYRRTIMVVEDGVSNTFLVDVFEVDGGSQHDYMVHGSADKDQTLLFKKSAVFFADSLASDGKIHMPTVTKELYGSAYRYQDFDSYGVTSQYWGNIRKVKKISGQGPWEGIFSGKKHTDSRLRMHLLAPTDCVLYVGEAPSIRRANEDPSKVENYMMPILTARRSGDRLVSRYVVVWEPFREKPWLNSVKLEHNSKDGIIITAGTEKSLFTIFWTPFENSTLAYGEMQFDGRFGVIHQQFHRTCLSAVDSALIKSKNVTLEGAKEIILTVIDAGKDEKGDFLKVSNQLNLDGQKEQWGILFYPGKHTRAIQLGPIEKGDMVRCPQGHGLIYDADKSTWYEKYSPGRTFKGLLRLRLVRRLYEEAAGTHDYKLRIDRSVD